MIPKIPSDLSFCSVNSSIKIFFFGESLTLNIPTFRSISKSTLISNFKWMLFLVYPARANKRLLWRAPVLIAYRKGLIISSLQLSSHPLWNYALSLRALLRAQIIAFWLSSRWMIAVALFPMKECQCYWFLCSLL